MLLIPDNSKLYFTLFGRAFIVTAIASTDAEANKHMMANPGQGVLAVEKGLVVMASLDDSGVQAK